MGGYGVDAQVLRLMNLSSRGCFAATLFRSPGGNCIWRVGHAERGVGVVGKAGVRQAGGNLPVVGVRRLVLVGAFQTSAAAILIETWYIDEPLTRASTLSGAIWRSTTEPLRT